MILICFDVANENGLSDCDEWERILEKHLKYQSVAVVGTMTDREDQRKVSTSDAHNHFSSLTPPLPYYEVSAKTGQGVKDMIESVLMNWVACYGGNDNTPIKAEKNTEVNRCFIN